MFDKRSIITLIGWVTKTMRGL